MSDPAKALFLSYASQDAAAAGRLCEGLRAAGLEVWFDVSELRGGDAWDHKIRRQIKECALFLPVVSAHTQGRREGYFRIEWRLASQRTYAMADGTPFLLPIVVDTTRDADALVPAEFAAVQWTRLPGGEVTADFVARVQELLATQSRDAPAPPGALSTVDAVMPKSAGPSRQAKWVRPVLAAAVVVIIALAATLARRTPSPAAPAAGALAGAWPRDPELSRARHFLFTLDAIPGDFSLAEDIVRPLLAARPSDPEVVTVAAEIAEEFVARGFDTSEARREQAQRLTERAVALAPDNPMALAALSRYLLFVNSQMARAEELARRAVALAPDEPRAHRILYGILTTTKPGPETEAFEARMVARFPADALVQYDVARRFKDENNLPAMEAQLDRTLALAPVTAALVWKAWLRLEVHSDVAGMKAALDRVPERQRLVPRVVAAFAVRGALTGERMSPPSC